MLGGRGSVAAAGGPVAVGRAGVLRGILNRVSFEDPIRRRLDDYRSVFNADLLLAGTMLLLLLLIL